MLLEETHSAYLPKYGNIGYLTWSNAVPNYYLKKVVVLSGHSDLGSGTTTSTTIINPVSNAQTNTLTSTGASNWGGEIGGPEVFPSDTLETRHYVNPYYPQDVDDTTYTLSNPNTTAMLEANVLDPTILPPFTNGFIISPPGNPPLAYINLATDQTFISLIDLQYKFKVSAGTNTTVYWDDQFIPADGSTPTDNLQQWSGSTGTETESTVYQITGTTLESGPNGVHYILPIYLLRDNQLVNGANNAVAVGQQVNLSVYAPGLNITNYQWTIPGMGAGTAFKNYDPEGSPSNPYTPLASSDLTNSSVSFYYSDGGAKSLSCTLTVNGHPLVIPVSLNSRRPTNATITATIEGIVAVDTNYSENQPYAPPVTYLHFGQGRLPNNGGMGFLASTITPPNDSSGKPFSGTFTWVQVIGNDTITLTDGNGHQSQAPGSPASGLDNQFPYFPPNWQLNPASDSPAVSLDGAIGDVNVHRSFSATMYLMWKPINLPNADGAVWVPLRAVTWSWAGTAIWSNSQWSLYSHSEPGPVGQVVPDFDETIEPQWSQVTVNQ